MCLKAALAFELKKGQVHSSAVAVDANDLEHFRSKLSYSKEPAPNGQANHADLATGVWDAMWAVPTSSSTWQDHQGQQLWPAYLHGAPAAVATSVAVPQAEKRAGPLNYVMVTEHLSLRYSIQGRSSK